MTYWTVVADEAERSNKPCKVFKQFNKPGNETARIKGLTWVHGFKNKKLAIEHLNKMNVPNNMRPKGYKTYDA